MKQIVSTMMAPTPALDVASRHLTQVTSGGWQIGQIEWLPSGDRLIAAADAKPASDPWHEHDYSIGLTGGQFSEIGAPRGPLGPFALSPDGKPTPASTAPQP